jgi:hypothetical protein
MDQVRGTGRNQVRPRADLGLSADSVPSARNVTLAFCPQAAMQLILFKVCVIPQMRSSAFTFSFDRRAAEV